MKPQNGGVDLLDFWRGEVSPRRLLLLIKHLPADSEFVRAVAPDDAELSRYSPEWWVLRDLRNAYVQVHSGKGQPVLIPTPMEAIEQRKRAEQRRLALEAQQARINARNNGTEVA